jgi:hypothetical protein
MDFLYSALKGTVVYQKKNNAGGKTMAVMKEKRKFNFVLLGVLLVVIVAGIFYQFFLKI